MQSTQYANHLQYFANHQRPDSLLILINPFQLNWIYLKYYANHRRLDSLLILINPIYLDNEDADAGAHIQETEKLDETVGHDEEQSKPMQNADEWQPTDEPATLNVC